MFPPSDLAMKARSSVCNNSADTYLRRTSNTSDRRPEPSMISAGGSGVVELGATPASANNTDSGIVSSGVPGAAILHEGSTSKPATGSPFAPQLGYEMQPVKMKSRVFVVPVVIPVTEKFPN